MAHKIRRYNASSDRAEILDHFDHHGYAIIENVLSAGELHILRSEIAPYLTTTAPDSSNAFMGGRTLRFGRLLHRIPSTRSLVRHPTVLPNVERVLTRYAPTAQVHFTGVMHILPGEAAQVLHRDIVPFPNPSPVLVVATMWAVSDFTRGNGATVFVPGSHLWPEDRWPLKEELCVAEMPAGSVLLYAGNLIHGAGRCVTGTRTGVALQYSVGWLRQEENQYLAVPLEVARTFDHDLQKLMGYQLAARHWGYVDQMHPMDFLNGTEGMGLDPGKLTSIGKQTILANVGGLRTFDGRYPVTLGD